jgi:hypothetical protein
MEPESLGPLESMLADVPVPNAPMALRQQVLRKVDRELAAARWDRRLARTARTLLILGVAMNVAIGVPWTELASPPRQRIVRQQPHETLLEAAVHVAEATDAESGRRFALHLASAAGWTLTTDDLRAIDIAIEQRSHDSAPKGG